MPSDRVRAILPGDTATTWDAIAPIVPQQAYLGGGTAIAVHLGHRISRDLDFFFHNHSIDLDDLASRLSAAGPFAVTERSPGTLNGLFSSTKVQFLHADEGRPQHLLEQPRKTDGLRIAELSDLIAMKLKVVGDRGELRDYFDLMTIEQRTGRTADEGLALFVERFQPQYPQQAINHILLGLGYFDDVDPDDALPVPRSDIVDYWTRRQREITASRGRLPRPGQLLFPYSETTRISSIYGMSDDRIPYMEELAPTVHGWLESSGLSPSAVARRAGVSASTMHRILNDLVDPSVGTLREIAVACGIQIDLTARPLSDPQAAAAARALLEGGYEPPSNPGVTAWQERLHRMATSSDPVDIVKSAAIASGPLYRPGAVLLHGEVTLARVASAGDASKGHWAISGASGLYLPPPSAAVPPVTILWCEDVRTVMHLLADTELRQSQRPDRAVLAVITAEPELFAGSFTEGIVRYAAPIQIVLDCVAQGGALGNDAIEEAMSW